MYELLLAVAIALTHQPTLQLECTTNFPVTVPAWGASTTDPPRIWIKPWLCKRALQGWHSGLRVLAHEILHVRLPNRTETWVQLHDNWYAENVVRWKMRRIAARGP